MHGSADFVMNYKECKQQRDDITADTAILKLMADAIVKASAMPLDKTGRKLLNDAFEGVRTSIATKKVREEFSRRTSEAYRYKYAANRMSLSMRYQNGKWVTCPAGHTYYTIDYGIAMYRQKCPNCAAKSRSSKTKCTVM